MVPDPKGQHRDATELSATELVRAALQVEWALHTTARETTRRVKAEHCADRWRVELADRLRYLVGAMAGVRDVSDSSDIVSLLAGWAMERVDWLELADTYLTEA
jgi:hypothetical protein